MRHIFRSYESIHRNGSSCRGCSQKPGASHENENSFAMLQVALGAPEKFHVFPERTSHPNCSSFICSSFGPFFSSFIVAHLLVSLSLCVISGVFLFFIGARKWPCGVCQRSLFAMALKRWAVRQISGLLSDYLEGITEQNLQAGNGDGRMVRWL